MQTFLRISIGVIAAISCLLINLYKSRLVINQRKQDQNEIWEPYNNTNPHIGWCPNATCSNSPICTPCRRRFLLIIATGRSGSTTLLSMMNQLPGVRLSGENHNEIRKEMDAVNNILADKRIKLKSTQVNAYRHNPIPDGALSCPTQQMFEVINPPDEEDMNKVNFDDSRTIIGFKTITLHQPINFEETVQFIKDTFPCARIILNIRSDTEGQVESRAKHFHNNKNDGDILELIRLENSRIRNITKMFGDERARLLDMSRWTKEGTGLQDLNNVIYWLGFRNCKFSSLYHENKEGYELDHATSVTLGPNCHYPDIP